MSQGITSLRLAATSLYHITERASLIDGIKIQSGCGAIIDKRKSLGKLYYLNIGFLCYTVVFSLLAIALGYIKALQPFLFAASLGLLIIQIPSVTISSIYNYRIELGKPFVLIAIIKETGKLCSSVFDMLSWIITALLIFYLMRLYKVSIFIRKYTQKQKWTA